MNKKFITLICGIILIFTSCYNNSEDIKNTDTVPESSFNYEKYDGGISVIKYNGSDAEVTVPEFVDGSSVTKIGEGAFRECESIVCVTLPDSIEIIGESAFFKCINLCKINTPASLQEIGQDAFSKCGKLTEFYVPDSVTRLDGAFWDTGITTLNIPQCITRIDDFMFNRTSVTTDVIHSGITTIGIGAFEHNPAITELIIPESVTSIEGYAFAYCDNMISVYIHENVEKIMPHAFSGDSLTEINVSAENPYYTSVDGVLYTKNMKELVLYPCAKAGDVITVPDSVEYIGDCAYHGNLYLTEIIMTDNVIGLGHNAFMTCKSLETLTIPRGVTYINGSIILHCAALRDIYIPDNVTDYNSFGAYGCSNMTVHCSENCPIYKYYKDKPDRRTYKFELDYN